MRSVKILAFGFFATATLLPLAFAADNTATKKAMKEAMKGGLCKKVAAGEGSDDDKKKLLALFTDMAKETPGKGEAASWKEKAGALVSAAQAVVDGKADGNAQLKKAANCKACHDVHKGK
jgi:surface antigen